MVVCCNENNVVAVIHTVILDVVLMVLCINAKERKTH